MTIKLSNIIRVKKILMYNKYFIHNSQKLLKNTEKYLYLIILKYNKNKQTFA